ncbi:SoxH protein, homolog [Bathymodiolus heckerae thiotrophic gill symbiont]|uniref:rhodanese-like domain-containing protein n=1 Tax=Bathymodiolus heckerae thiotrophic gill symbiont TaxID=1052212 RepID=UPI0010B1E3C1|nr:rhodanese-like domain-containing protein [Bathymodiolus heckerae thiotrophic gill symbiont]SMN13859.1 SoxH protein, homolog [Bathymodiolus heckerae thiotrophic gill symbiont]SMN15794.1 SoxH protein, homolog [uncultured Candidatus Thioglobus sp.]
MLRYFLMMSAVFILTSAQADFSDWFLQSKGVAKPIKEAIIKPAKEVVSKSITKPIVKPEPPTAQLVDIDTDELIRILDTDPSVVLIDVRAPFEIKHTGTIKRGQNVNIMRGWLEFQISDYALSKDTPIVVYCGLNFRSPLAAKTLMEMGYSNVKNYADGFMTWKKRLNPVKVSDHVPESILYRKPVKVVKNVYSAIGATQPPTYENSNHNNNLSFIVTTNGVLVFNAGGNYLVAKAMHEEIKKITNQKVKYVVLENSQGHAILGANYWQQQGAVIIAHTETDKEIKRIGKEIYLRASSVQKDKIIGTKVIRPDVVFDKQFNLTMGGTKIELMHIGASHSPDDIQLWLPQKKLLISGDTAFNERLLPIFKHTNIKAWIKTWDKIEALAPEVVIPGHGKPTDLATVTKFTKDYLQYMYDQVQNLIDEDGSLTDAYNIDQSAYRDWGTYRELHRQNAERIFRYMEFE